MTAFYWVNGRSFKMYIRKDHCRHLCFQKVLKFWLDLGVDGFRVDAAPHLFEANHIRDEPPNGKTRLVILQPLILIL